MMSVFAWRRRQTRHFGAQWVPFAEVHLRSTAGRWYAFSVQVDTGAVISVFSRSAADLLGIQTATGEPIRLAGVDAPARYYHVQEIPTRIGDMTEFPMRVAVAEHEDVPNLLGRLDVFDRFQIDFDASLEETRITAPWLDEGMRRVWRHLLETEAEILERWQDHPLPGRVDEAARRFVNRADQLVGAGAGLMKLHRGSELPLVIRSLWELSIQFEYLMRDPEPRAELYLDFEHMTKYRLEQAWLKLPGEIGEHLREIPTRREGGKRTHAEYDRLKPKYTRSEGSEQVRLHWYPGTVRSLATEVGRDQEYQTIYATYSAWAHGDPWTSDRLSVAHGGILHPFIYWARLLIQVADAKKIVMTGDGYQSLEELAEGIT